MKLKLKFKKIALGVGLLFICLLSSGQELPEILIKNKVTNYKVPFSISSNFIDSLTVSNHLELTPELLKVIFGKDMGPYGQLNKEIPRKQYLIGFFNIEGQLGILLMLDAKPKDVSYWKEVMIILFNDDLTSYSNETFSKSLAVPHYGRFIYNGKFIDSINFEVQQGRVNRDRTYDNLEKTVGTIKNGQISSFTK